MAPIHGSKAYFSVQDSGGVARDMSAFLTDGSIDRSADTAEVSTWGSTSKKYIPGLKDGTIPIEGPFEVVADGYLSGILGVADRAFIYRPAGTGTGLPSYTGLCILTSYSDGNNMGDAASMSGEFQISGDVTRAIQ